MISNENHDFSLKIILAKWPTTWNEQLFVGKNSTGALRKSWNLQGRAIGQIKRTSCHKCLEFIKKRKKFGAQSCSGKIRILVPWELGAPLRWEATCLESIRKRKETGANAALGKCELLVPCELRITVLWEAKCMDSVRFCSPGCSGKCECWYTGSLRFLSGRWINLI